MDAFFYVQCIRMFMAREVWKSGRSRYLVSELEGKSMIDRARYVVSELEGKSIIDCASDAPETVKDFNTQIYLRITLLQWQEVKRTAQSSVSWGAVVDDLCSISRTKKIE